jgi:TPR repeat protein
MTEREEIMNRNRSGEIKRNRRGIRLLVPTIVLATLGFAGAAAAGDFTVGPAGDYAFIQDAIEAAGTMGDEVDRILIAEGVYRQCAYVSSGKRLVLSGGWNEDYTEQTDDPLRTALDADGIMRVLSVHTTDQPIELRIENMTFRNGWVRGCPPPGFEGCCVGNPGLEVWAQLADIQLQISNVVVEDGVGIGALINLKGFGGTLDATLDSVVLRRGPGGLDVEATDISYDDVLHEGAVNLTVLNSVISDNELGVRLSDGIGGEMEASFIGNTITRNSRVYEWVGGEEPCGPKTAGVDVRTGGVRSGLSHLRFYNNIIRDNTLSFAGVCHRDYSDPVASVADFTYALSDSPMDSLELVSNNLGEVAPYSFYTGPAPTLVDNINEDPLFVDPDGESPNAFRLAVGSPMIDRGTLAVPDPPGLPETDIAGNARVNGFLPDLGAFELSLSSGRWWFTYFIYEFSYFWPPTLDVIEGASLFRPEESWIFEKGCESGDPASCLQLGDLYRLGLGVKLDPSRAAKHYMAACDGGIGNGCFEAAILFTRGKMRDLKLAQTLWKKAAARYAKGVEQGLVHDMDRLALLYSAGWGVPKRNPQMARKLWAKAAAIRGAACGDGDASACNELGVMHSRGYGVDRNDQKAFSLYQKACDHGSALGCFSLGGVFHAGQGVTQNLSMAAKHYAQACENDIPAACDFLKRLDK